jgi:hypothetical protein
MPDMTPEFDLKFMVGNGPDGKARKVHFQCYRDQALWYQTESGTRPDGVVQPGFNFPVPIDDIGTATFLNVDKAMLFMRYIRKHLEFLKNAKKEQERLENEENEENEETKV